MNLLEHQNISKKTLILYMLFILFNVQVFAEDYESITLTIEDDKATYPICPPKDGKDLKLTLQWFYSDGQVWDSKGCGYTALYYTIEDDPRVSTMWNNESEKPFYNGISLSHVPYNIQSSCHLTNSCPQYHKNYVVAANRNGGVFTREIIFKGSHLNSNDNNNKFVMISITHKQRKFDWLSCSNTKAAARRIRTIELNWGDPSFSGEVKPIDGGSSLVITPSEGTTLQTNWNSYTDFLFDIKSFSATTKGYINFEGTASYENTVTDIPWDKGNHETEIITQPGYYTVQYTLLDECGTHVVNKPATFDVSFSCSGDDLTTIEIGSASSGFIKPPGTELFNDGMKSVISDSWWIEPGKKYKLVPTESPYLEDFFNYYDIGFTGGVKNYNKADQTFNIDPGIKIGRFKFRPVFKYNTEFFEDCNPMLPTTVVTVGGTDQTYYSECLLTIPRDLINHDSVKIEKNEDYSWIFNYFKWTFKSKEAIILEPGVVLRDGAIVEVINPYITDDVDGNFDEAKNFVHSAAYDEWGFITSESRSYFDNLGTPLQSQSKNLSNKVVMATQTILDYYGRPSLQTLPAPVRGLEFKEHPTCGYKFQVGGNMVFRYDEGFVKNEHGEFYSYKDFDENYADNDPVPVENITPGTLGWYYSENNFEPKRSLDVVVLNSTVKSEAEYTTPLDGTKASRTEIHLKKGFKVNRGDPFRAYLDSDLPLSAGESSTDAILSTMAEDHVPTTKYPFTRAVYNQDGSQEVVSQIPPGDYHQLNSGREGETYITNYSSGMEDYISMYTRITGRNFSPAGNVYRKKILDANQHKSIIYYDNAGNELIKQNLPVSGMGDGIQSYKFYNTLGQLIVSVSPNGVKDFREEKDYNLIDKVTYKYNNRGFLVETESLDEGITKFLYAKDGRIRYSQNAEQHSVNRYSYTDYDRNGRAIESGVCIPSGGWEWGSATMKASLDLFNTAGQCQGTKTDVTELHYDLPYPNWETDQLFTRGKLSYSVRPEENIYNLYSYDARGRVSYMYQWIGEDMSIEVNYRYDRKGGVSEIHYQPGEGNSDEFYHYYYYDKDGQLLSVYTSTDYVGPINRQKLATPMAQYDYYKHGPLKRKTIGEKLQGIDYIYNINGWLKAINNTKESADPGGDGTANDINPDVYAMNLEYFSGDYNNRITDIESIETGQGLYDGTITGMAWITQKPEDAIDASKGVTNNAEMYVYNYDNQYQLLAANYGTPDFANSNFAEASTNAYDVAIGGYDHNGNIASIQRNDENGDGLDNFTYTYDPAKPNQLKSVSNYTTSDYEYNFIGQLKNDNVKNSERHYSYNAAGKVTGIYKDANKTETNKFASYTYGPNGFRVKKENENEELFYARDLSGKILSVYKKDDEGNYEQKEVPVYADSRIGVAYVKGKDSPAYTFEMSNHLGNVTNTYEPEDQNWWTKRLVTGELYVDYKNNLSVKEAEANFTHFAEANTVIAEAVTTLKNGGEATAKIYCDADRNIQVQDIVAPLKYNYESSHNIGRVTWSLPPRTVSLSEVTIDYMGNVSYESKTEENITTYRAAGLKIQDVVAPVSYGEETGNVTAALVSDGNGKCTISNLKSTIKAAGENEVIPLSSVTFNLNPQQVKAIVSIDPVGKGTVRNVSRNFMVYAPDNTVLGTEKVTRTINGSIAEVTATIKAYGENVILSDVHSTIGSGALEEVHLGKIQFALPGSETQNTAIKVTGSTDYYPFGSPMAERKLTGDKRYRFGYQGQFAEDETEETGYNAFEARLYDGKIGRWTTIDPAGQFFSPYLGMGNNPMRGVDPDGAVVWFLQGEVRGNYFLTTAANIGLATDLKGNAMIYHTGSIGLAAGKPGKYSGIQMGVCGVEGLEQFKGSSINSGVIGKYKIGGGIEMNVPWTRDGPNGGGLTYSFKGKGSANSKMLAIYADYSYTESLMEGSLPSVLDYLEENYGDWLSELGLNRSELESLIDNELDQYIEYYKNDGNKPKLNGIEVDAVSGAD